MIYTVFIRKSAQKSIVRLASSLQDRIFHAIRELASDPRPLGVKNSPAGKHGAFVLVITELFMKFTMFVV